MELLDLDLFGLFIRVTSFTLSLELLDECQLLLELSLIILLATSANIGRSSTLISILFLFGGLLLVEVLPIVVVVIVLVCWLSVLHVLDHLLLKQKGVHLAQLGELLGVLGLLLLVVQSGVHVSLSHSISLSIPGGYRLLNFGFVILVLGLLLLGLHPLLLLELLLLLKHHSSLILLLLLLESNHLGLHDLLLLRGHLCHH